MAEWLQTLRLHNRYEVEIKLNSLMYDGTKSWVVISRSIERYFTELALDHNEPIETCRMEVAVIRVNFTFIPNWRTHSDGANKIGLHTRSSTS